MGVFLTITAQHDQMYFCMPHYLRQSFLSYANFECTVGCCCDLCYPLWLDSFMQCTQVNNDFTVLLPFWTNRVISMISWLPLICILLLLIFCVNRVDDMCYITLWCDDLKFVILVCLPLWFNCCNSTIKYCVAIR